MENCHHPHHHPHRIILTWSTVPPWPRQSSRRYEEEPPLSCRLLYAPGDFKYMVIMMIMVMSIVLMLIIKFFTRDSMIVLLNFKVVKKLFRFNSEHSPQVLRKK